MLRKWSSFALWVLVLALTAFTLGSAFQDDSQAPNRNLYSNIRLFSQVLSVVQANYVDEVDTEKLIQGAITGMLDELDPHSTYLDAERYRRLSERNRGEYYGIGISFDIREDGYITVIAPIEGSPSARLGIRPGDKIVKIEGQSAHGIKTEEVFDKLRGPKGSHVHVSVRRVGVDELLEFDIERDKIPIQSVPYVFMLDRETGYIMATNFSSTTGQELEEAIDALEEKGMKRLVFDLRSNTGGLLDQAIEVASQFLDGGKSIVYTKGRIDGSTQYYYSDKAARHGHFPLVVLIDHGSASASEIVAGAIQDHDRGLVAGITSFGKGLVQRQFPLRDNSAMLLTVARYYTPSGRSIQRDYSDKEKYREDGMPEAEDQIEPDSVLAKRPQFKTDAGRIVLGGGGITPDVRLRYRRYTPVQMKLGNQIFLDFVTQHLPKHPVPTADFATFNASFQVDDDLYGAFKTFYASRPDPVPPDSLDASADYIRRMIKAEIAGVKWTRNERFQVLLQDDEMVKEAIGLLPKAELMAKRFDEALEKER
jgi:carboxyl-terminal processing protease